MDRRTQGQSQGREHCPRTKPDHQPPPTHTPSKTPPPRAAMARLVVQSKWDKWVSNPDSLSHKQQQQQQPKKGSKRKNLPVQLLFLVLLVSADIGRTCTMARA